MNISWKITNSIFIEFKLCVKSHWWDGSPAMHSCTWAHFISCWKMLVTLYLPSPTFLLLKNCRFLTSYALGIKILWFIFSCVLSKESASHCILISGLSCPKDGCYLVSGLLDIFPPKLHISCIIYIGNKNVRFMFSYRCPERLILYADISDGYGTNSLGY